MKNRFFGRKFLSKNLKNGQILERDQKFLNALYEAKLFLAQEEEADKLALDGDGKRKKRSVHELGYMTSKLIEASDNVVEALKDTAADLGIDLGEYGL